MGKELVEPEVKDPGRREEWLANRTMLLFWIHKYDWLGNTKEIVQCGLMVDLKTEHQEITEVVMGMVNMWKIMLKVEKLKTNLDVETWKKGKWRENLWCEFCVVYLVAFSLQISQQSIYCHLRKSKLNFFQEFYDKIHASMPSFYLE